MVTVRSLPIDVIGDSDIIYNINILDVTINVTVTNDVNVIIWWYWYEQLNI